MAWGAWHVGAITRPKAHAGDKYAEQPHLQSNQAMYLRGVIMNVSNPKVTLFFIAFLPQFTDPAHGSMAAQFIQLGALFMLATLLIFGGIALGAGFVRNGLESARAQQNLNRLAALVFVGLSVKLLWFT